MSTYPYIIPAVPPSLNEYTRMHWAKKERVRKDFQSCVWAALNEKGHRCPRGLERVELHAVLVFAKDRRRDSDNFGSVLWKFVQDVLVTEGIIPDDDHERCTAYPPRIAIGEKETTLLSIGVDG